MKINKYLKIAIFQIVFLGISFGQWPLDIRGNTVVGIGGVIVNSTTLDQAIKMCAKSPYTVTNFRQSFRTEYRAIVYSVERRKNNQFLIWTILVRNSRIGFVMLKTSMRNESVLEDVYKEVWRARRARLGYPSSESGLTRFAWEYPGTTYILALNRRDSDHMLQIVETVGVNK